jgi:hypothetical protein
MTSIVMPNVYNGVLVFELCPLLAPIVEQDFQMNWALLIISKRSTFLKKLHLPAFSYPLTFSTFYLIKFRTSRGGAQGEGGWIVGTPPSRQKVGKLSNPSWIGRKETKIFE